MPMFESEFPVKDDNNNIITIAKHTGTEAMDFGAKELCHVIYCSEASILDKVEKAINSLKLPLTKFDGGITVLSDDSTKLLSALVGSGIISRASAIEEGKIFGVREI